MRKPQISWARLISNTFSPPITWGILAFPIASREAQSPEQAIVWALVYCVMVCILPAGYIAYMVRRGQITDLHIQDRRQRIRPFLVLIFGALMAWWFFTLTGAPPLMPQFSLISLLLVVSMLLITLVWQISMHTMSIACAVVTAGALYGLGPAVLLSPLIPVVGVARIKLERHTLSQVIAGCMLGSCLTLALLIWLNPGS